MTDARAQLASQLYADRRDRDLIFGTAAKAGFGEPAWDMLLALYTMEANGDQCSGEDLIAAAGVEADIAVRYLQWMVSYGLMRVSDGEFAQFGKVQLEAVGRSRLEAFLDRGLRDGVNR